MRTHVCVKGNSLEVLCIEQRDARIQRGAAVTVPCERIPLHVYTFRGESGIKHLFAVTVAAPPVRVVDVHTEVQ